MSKTKKELEAKIEALQWALDGIKADLERSENYAKGSSPSFDAGIEHANGNWRFSYESRIEISNDLYEKLLRIDNE